MLAAGQHAGLLRIPAVRIVLAPGIFDGAPDLWPVALQPFGIARQLPVAISLDHGAEMPVGAWADDVEAGAERQLLAKRKAAGRQHVVGEFGLAQRALQRREQMRQRLLVVPDMGAGALARAVLRVLALPRPDLAALQPDHGCGAQQRQGRARRILDLGRQGRAEHAVAERRMSHRRACPSALGRRVRLPRSPPSDWRSSCARSASRGRGLAHPARCGTPSRCRPSESSRRWRSALSCARRPESSRAPPACHARAAGSYAATAAACRNAAPAAGRVVRIPSRTQRGCRTTGRGSESRCGRRPRRRWRWSGRHDRPAANSGPTRSAAACLVRSCARMCGCRCWRHNCRAFRPACR